MAAAAGAQAGIEERSYVGEPCVHFYRPVERGPDGQLRINQYGEGATVCHGSRMYRCEQQAWSLLGACSTYDPAFVASVRSELLEGYLAGPAPKPAPPPAPVAGPETAQALPAGPAATPAPTPPAAAVPATAATPVTAAPAAMIDAAAASVPPAAEPAAAVAPVTAASAVLWPSCLASFIPGIERLGQHEYRQLVAGSALRGQEPQVLARLALRAAAQGEYYKALYLSRIALDYDQFNAELWENHASFAEQVGFAAEAQQARRNSTARQAQMQPLQPTLLAGAGATNRPATLADWVALASLVTDDVAARSGDRNRLQVSPRTATPAAAAADGLAYRLPDVALEDALAGLTTVEGVRRGEPGAGPGSWSYAARRAPDAEPDRHSPARAGEGWAGVPVTVLWASGTSRAAFLAAQVMHLPGSPPTVASTTLGAQAAGQPVTTGSVDLTGQALSVPRLAALCTPDRHLCTPPLLPLEVLLSDEDFTDVGLPDSPDARAGLRAALAQLSEAYANGQPVVLPPGNADPNRLPDRVAGIDGVGACLAIPLQPEVWLAPP